MLAKVLSGAWLVLTLALTVRGEISITCNTRLLQYYGLEGMGHAIPYTVMEQINSDNFCPNLEQTCCSPEDFNLTRELWIENSQRIKGYLTQIFRTLQKIATIQSSLIQFMPKIMAKNTLACKRIDATFFNSPVKFDEVYFYIRNALEGFAYIQKGFYCMLCDPRQHPYFQLKINYGRFFVQMSQKSCDDLMFFFREFLAYRVYFFNPLVKNLNQVLNCVHDTDVQRFDFDNLVSYQGVEDCLENKNYCWKVCKEFRLGISSNLFIGQLSEYKRMMNEMEGLISQLSDTTAKFEELDFLDQNFSGEFFARNNDTIVQNNMNLLKDMNLSKAELLFTAEGGVDLFYTAVGSNYFLTDASTLENVKRHYDLLSPGDNQDTVLDASVNRPADGYDNPPDLVNTRIEPDAAKKQLVKDMAPDGFDVDAVEAKYQTQVAAGGAVDSIPEPDAPKEPAVDPSSVDQLEKQYMAKLNHENPDDPSDDKKGTSDGFGGGANPFITVGKAQGNWWRNFLEKVGWR